MFQCPLGLELLQQAKNGDSVDEQFQCPLGLELLRGRRPNRIALGVFQCPLGLELLRYVLDQQELMRTGFNALTGLSCYGKNVQYFKFFMILFYTYLLFIGVY